MKFKCTTIILFYLMKSLSEIFEVIISVFPLWVELINEANTNIVKLPGQSNDIYLITINAPVTPNKFIIRFFGKIGNLIDTRIERKVFSTVCKLKTGLEEYKTTDTYRVEQFIQSVPFSGFELKESSIIKSFAHEISKIHYSKELKEILKGSKQHKPFLNLVLDDWVNTVVSNQEIIMKKCQSDLEKRTVMEFFSIVAPPFKENVQKLYDLCSDSLVVSHNDIHPGNMLMRSDKKITLLDYEYLSYNYAAFDLAGYSSEACTDVAIKEFPFYKHNEENRLSNAEIELLCKEYLKSQHSYIMNGQSVDEYVEKEYKLLYEQTKAMSPYINLYWAVWYMIMMDWDNINQALIILSKKKLELFKMLKSEQ